MTRLTLYYSPGACSQGPHIALEEAGADFDVKEFAVHNGATRSEEYLAINPRGRVPALRVDGRVLTENCAVLLYIARRFPQAGLLPEGILEEAECLSFMAWIASTVHPTFAHVVRPERFAADDGAHPSIRETCTATYWAQMQEIDRRIAGGGPWIQGGRYSICDANLLPFWGFARRIRLPMDEVPHFTAWKDRMIERPAVRRALQREDSLLLRQGKA